jgi:2'-5' RNA ligase
MKLTDLIEKKQEKGTYAGLRFGDGDNDKIAELVNNLNLPNPIEKGDIHMTLLYSRKHLPNYVAAGEIDEWAYPKNFHVFDTFDKKRALVMMLDCPFAQKRHKELMDKHQATYDYPEYLPHITLSYDIGDMEVPKWENIPKEFHINNEYQEELKLEWKPK